MRNIYYFDAFDTNCNVQVMFNLFIHIFTALFASWISSSTSASLAAKEDSACSHQVSSIMGSSYDLKDTSFNLYVVHYNSRKSRMPKLYWNPMKRNEIQSCMHSSYEKNMLVSKNITTTKCNNFPHLKFIREIFISILIHNKFHIN